MTELPTSAPDALLDAALEDAPLAFVDLEMTGLDPAIDRVVEVCVMRVVRGQIVDEVSSLVNPGAMSLAGHGMKIHGIPTADIEAAPTFAELFPSLERALAGAALVAHAAEWDVAFLRAEFERAARVVALPCVIDTLRLSRRAFALPGHSLDALATHFAIPRGEAHRARSDVLVLRAVWERCVAELQPVNVRDVAGIRIGERKARDAVVAACREAAQSGQPVRIVYRPAGKPKAEFVLRVTQVREDIEPPRVLGYDLTSRGRREFRADRILTCELQHSAE
jgi:DNA polymerase-3 subunit epsilon